MKRFFRLVAGSLLIITLTLSSALSVLAAETNETKGKKTNLNYEKGSLEELLDTTISTRSSRSTSKELIYTYEQDGVSYKVYDQASIDLSSSHSFIYKIDINNTETLVREEIVNVEDNVVTTTIIENGQKTVDVLELYNNIAPDLELVPEADVNLLAGGTWDGFPVSNIYEFWDSFKRSYSVAGTTVAAVSITINAIVKIASNLSAFTKIITTVISSLVSYIVNNNVKRTYAIEDVAFRWTKIPNAYIQQKAVERTIRTFYLDSNYATVIDDVTTYVYSKHYED